MSWWGKTIGGTLGFAVGGPLGALLGTALGHNFDSGSKANPRSKNDVAQREKTQSAFFAATFTVMGTLAKCDGQVNQEEINYAERLMHQLGMDAEHRMVAQKLFAEGKTTEFPIDSVLDQFRMLCGPGGELTRLFLEILIQAAYADGEFNQSERRVLLHTADRLGVLRGDYNRLEAMTKAHINARRGAAKAAERVSSLAQAYQALGLTPSAQSEEVTRAYRKLLSEHHPDKLVSRGLPEEMIRVANEKTQDINSAFETIRSAKGF